MSKKFKPKVGPQMEVSPLPVVFPYEETIHQLDDIINVFGAVHRFTYNGGAERFEPVHDNVSLTVPDMVMTMHDIMSKFTRGLPVPVSQGVYIEEDLSMIDSMNRFELIDLQRKLRKSADELRKDIMRQYNEAHEKEKQESFNKAVNEKVSQTLAAKGSNSDPKVEPSTESNRS